MAVITIGIDLAKNVFQTHGVDENDKCQLKKRGDSGNSRLS